ncbi:glycosyltransferase family 2 protein, partial [Campylobacter jejuni]|nr:glycosyltransferase family 2 protein [Campylobacter jejuni]
VYNVEKYLDDFFKSIINQRLDFKSNIYLICVDDGSTDNSANIIKKYQKKYPKNITYLYKENGGQASSRNLGLKYLKENDLNIFWVTFTDPDDFLDRDYFYE